MPSTEPIRFPVTTFDRRRFLALGAGAVSGLWRAQAIMTRPDTDARQVQAVSVPAGQHGRVARRVPIAVQAHRLAQALERPVVKLVDHAFAPQAHGEIGRPRPVCRVAGVVEALAVVQVRKPRQHGGIDVERCRQRPAVEPHPAPVRQPVDAAFEVKPELRPHDGQRLVDDLRAALLHERNAYTSPLPCEGLRRR